MEEKHSQSLRILEKPVDDFLVNLENFSQRQKYNFHLFWLHRGMLLAFDRGLFPCGYFVLCQFVFMWFEAEVGTRLDPDPNYTADLVPLL